MAAKKTKRKTKQTPKPLPPFPPTPRLYIEYDETRDGGEALDDGPWPNHADTNVSVQFIQLHREPPKHRFFYHSIEVSEELKKLDTAYLAVVRYSTGDTFGHTNGAWYVVDIAPTYKEAEKILDRAINEKGYKPWEGYFERFECTEIHTMEVV